MWGATTAEGRTSGFMLQTLIFEGEKSISIELIKWQYLLDSM
jgi:hypothetical protein